MEHNISQALITNPVLIFFTVLVILLLAPLIFKKIKVPHIVGLILAGVVVGPYGFHVLDRDASFQIFGQVGLLYLMFLAGLEIDLYNMRKNMGKGVVFGLYTTFIPLVLGMLMSVWLLGVDWITAVLLASMYTSHTLIAYPIVSRFGLSKSPVVLITIVGTIIAILGALLALAVTVDVQRLGAFSIKGVAVLLIKLLVYCALVSYVYPRVTRWFFRTFSDQVTQYVFVLAMVFFSSWLAQVIGLEPVLGAFLAGLVMNRYVPASSPLMSRIEFVGNAIFIPYFLIGVGMMINVSAISNWDTLWVSLNMIVVALLVKWLAAWATQKTYKMSVVERDMMFGLSAAHTAVALAVVMIGYELTLPDGSHLINESIMNGVVLMILVTCAVSPIVTSRASAKLKVEMISSGEVDEDEDIHNTRSLRTLIPVSNPITAAQLVNVALMMKRRPNNESLIALHVRNDNSQGSRAIGQTALKLATEPTKAVNLRMQTIERYDLNTVMGIVNTVKERNITDVVVGIHARSTVMDSFYGSKIDELLTKLNKMVLITRCYIPINTVTRIIVAVPAKAEFETGFELWIIRLTNMAEKIGCRLIYYASSDTIPYIKGVVHKNSFRIRPEYNQMNDWGDLMMLTNVVLDDDLFVMVSARRTSISFSSELEETPNLLSKYFNHSNLLIVYPEQFGATPNLASFNDPIAVDLDVPSSEIVLGVRTWWRFMKNRWRTVKRHVREMLGY